MRAALIAWAFATPTLAAADPALEQAALRAYDAGDIARAEALWREQAASGSVDAMMALAALVEPGGEGRNDLNEARALYVRAAAAGDPLADRRLIILEERFGAPTSSRRNGAQETKKSEKTQ